MIDYDNLIERLNDSDCCDKCTYKEKRACAGSAKCVLSEYSAAALSTLWAENEKLRAELAELRAQWDMYGGDEGITATYAELERVKAERDAAIEQLHGICSACQNYSPYHNRGKCRFCVYELARDRDAEINDNWEWRGRDKEG